jgi:integrase
MSKSKKCLGDQVYQDEWGFWLRINVNGKRSWKKLKAQSERAAKREAMNLTDDLAVGKSIKKVTFKELAQEYINKGCPDPLHSRRKAFCELEEGRIEQLLPFFGALDPEEIVIPKLMEHADWRMKRVTKGSGERTVELEWVTLSNVLSLAVFQGKIKCNYIRSGRPRLRTDRDDARGAKRIRHCREFAPESGAELHRLAAYFFSNPQSEVLGWQMLLEAFTGCRTSEIIRLRMDAINRDQAGFVDGNYLFLQRCKSGVNPWAMIHPALAELLRVHRIWKGVRFPACDWYLPGRYGVEHVEKNALGHGLRRATKNLGLPHRTSHAMRSFYVTLRRGAGVSDTQVAAEIGDKTVELLRTTYGSLPPNWTGGAKIDFLPENGEQPAWAVFQGWSL